MLNRFLFTAAPLRLRIQQLENENQALRNGEPNNPSYLHDYPPNTGASNNYINNGSYIDLLKFHIANHAPPSPKNYLSFFAQNCCELLTDETGARPNRYNACQSNPCLNGGSCQPFANGFGFKCNCLITWSGIRCQTSTYTSFFNRKSKC